MSPEQVSTRKVQMVGRGIPPLEKVTGYLQVTCEGWGMDIVHLSKQRVWHFQASICTLLLLFVMRWEIPMTSFGCACRDWIPPDAPCFWWVVMCLLSMMSGYVFTQQMIWVSENKVKSQNLPLSTYIFFIDVPWKLVKPIHQVLISWRWRCDKTCHHVPIHNSSAVEQIFSLQYYIYPSCWSIHTNT